MRHQLLTTMAVCFAAVHFAFAQPTQVHRYASFGDGEGKFSEIISSDALPSGDVVVGGRFRGLIDFDPDTSAAFMRFSSDSQGEVFLARYGADGELIWLRTIRSDRRVSIANVNVVGGDLYVSGWFIQEARFGGSGGGDLTGVSPNDADGYLAKYDAAGNLLWTKSLTGSGINTYHETAGWNADTIFALGVFGDSIQFAGAGGPWSYSSGAGDVFFQALNPQTGALYYTITLAGTGYDNPRAIAVSSDGKVFVGADFTSSLQPNPLNPTTITSSGGNDALMACYQAQDGGFLWAQKVAGYSTDLASDLILIGDTALAFTGVFNYAIALDPTSTTTTSGNNKDLFLALYDTAGTYHWGHTFGNTSTDDVRALTTDALGNIWMGGYFVGSVDFDPSAASQTATGAGGDAFAAGYAVSNGTFAGLRTWPGTSFSKVNSVLGVADSLHAFGIYYNTTQIDTSSQSPTFTAPTSSSGEALATAYPTYAAGTSPGSGSTGGSDTWTPYGWKCTSRAGGDDEIRDLLYDELGNLYVAGVFSGEVDLDLGSGVERVKSATGQNGFIASYTPNFQLRWVKHLSGTGTVQLHALSYSNGQLYFLSSFDNSVELDTTTYASPIAYSTLYGALNTSGQVQWAKVGGGISSQFPTDIVAHPDGCFIGGYYIGTFVVDSASTTGTLVASNRAIFVASFTSNGSFNWAFEVDGSSNEYANGLALGPDSALYLAGSYRMTVDFDPSTTSSTTLSSVANSNDPFLAKYSWDGTFQWVRSAGSSSFEAANCVATDPSGAVYLGSDLAQTHIYGTDTLSATGSNDALLIKYDPAGNYQWSQPLGGTGLDAVKSIFATDTAVFMAGYLSGIAQLDPNSPADTTTPQGSQEYLFWSCYDTSGTYLNAFTHSTSGEDMALALTGRQGTLTLGGFYEGHSNFPTATPVDPNSGWYGSRDGLLLEFGQPTPCDTTYDTLTVASCAPYILDNQAYTQSGMYTQTLQTAAGCDSILTLNLTILPAYADTASATACTSYTWTNGQSYTQSGTYTQTLQTAAGCDSILTLNLTILPAYADTASATACTSYTWTNGQSYTQSGTYTQTLTTAAGCDSILTLNLTIDELPAATVPIQISYANPDTVEIYTTAAYDTYQWYTPCINPQLISGVTDSLLQITTLPQNEVFLVVQKGTCTDTSTCQLLQIGHPELHTPTFQAVPNPAHTHIQFTLDPNSAPNSPFSGTLSIYTSTGQLLQRSPYSPNQNISTTHWPTGNYIAVLQGEHGSWTTKFQVNR